ncbi:MAG: hypothetical protein CMJ46_12995 [Planctomyces sp.]|nr:hypothetical protein [Planctomyces sp.]
MNDRDEFQFEKPGIDWQSCQGGEIGKVSAFLKRRRRVAVAKKASIGLGLLLMVAGAGWLTFADRDLRDPDDHQVGQLYCSDVEKLLQPLLEGELTADTVQAIETHLEGCPGCVEHLEEARLEYEKNTGEKAKFQFSSEHALAPSAPVHETIRLVSHRFDR